MINLTVNGKKTELAYSTTLTHYLRELEVNVKFIAVAYNGNVVKKEDYSSITLKEGDDLEIVRPVGGG